MSKARLARALVLACGIGTVTAGQAAPPPKVPGWVIDTTGGTSASIGNASGTMTLTLGCIAPDLGMTVSWTAAKLDSKGSFTATVGKANFTMHPGKARNALLLSDLPGKAVGLDKPFLDALRTGEALVLGGSAFANVPPADLTFPLAGSGKALKTVAAGCKAPAAPAPIAKPASAGAAVSAKPASTTPAEAVPAPTTKSVGVVEGALGQKDMKALVGHPVTHNPGTVDRLIYVYNGNGTYDVNTAKGRVDGGKYTIKADGQLCWDRAGGITGCFQYYHKGGKLRVRNMTNGADIGVAELG
jgi:hypothetical protein